MIENYTKGLLDDNILLDEFIGTRGLESYELRFHESWDWLMPITRKINNLNKATQFAIFKTYVSCTVEKGSKFYRDFSYSNAEYITSEQSDIEAVWKLAVDFVRWYNNTVDKTE